MRILHRRREFMWITIKIKILFINLNFMAIFCHELFAIQRMEKRKSLFFFIVCLFYGSRRAKNGKDMNYFWQIYCQLCAYSVHGQTNNISSFYAIKWVLYMLKLYLLAGDTHRGHKYGHARAKKMNTNRKSVQRCTHHGNHEISGTKK